MVQGSRTSPFHQFLHGVDKNCNQNSFDLHLFICAKVILLIEKRKNLHLFYFSNPSFFIYRSIIMTDEDPPTQKIYAKIFAFQPFFSYLCSLERLQTLDSSLPPLEGIRRGPWSFSGRSKIFARPPQDIAPPAARYSHGRGKLVTCRISPFSPPLFSLLHPRRNKNSHQ